MPKAFFLVLLELLLLGALAFPSQADDCKSVVVAVTDGDSLILAQGQNREKVILYGIDCPETQQAFGAEAKAFTNSACYRKTVGVNMHGKDSRGRTIAEIFLPDGSSLNRELVKHGLAWWSDKYAPQDKELQSLQSEARAGKIGLWAGLNPIAPWIFRNGEKSVKAEIKSGN
ncbi:MAG: thermonuclease family protein [Candidatus Obscuribacterales bacterium]|nr:thermonuclease family protein [Candidatus Obscuribacterales bacterium]